MNIAQPSNLSTYVGPSGNRKLFLCEVVLVPFELQHWTGFGCQPATAGVPNSLPRARMGAPPAMIMGDTSYSKYVGSQSEICLGGRYTVPIIL